MATPAAPPTLTTAALPPTALPPPPVGGISLWVDPHLPALLRTTLEGRSDFSLIDHPEPAALRLGVGGGRPVSQWIYTLAAPFPTLAQGVGIQDLYQAWHGQASGPFGGRPILMEPGTLALFSALWEAPAAGAAEAIPGEQLLSYAWEHRPAWAIIPFESLEPGWKVLEVDGQSPIRKDFNPIGYPLALTISLDGDPVLVEAVSSLYGAGSASPLVPPGNRDPNRLTTLAMTGVTALVRATAFAMEQRGISYPAQDVGEWLRSADLTHISNEVPFAQNCPFPDPLQPGMRFCSDPRYLALLEDVGTDIVELTGDHFQDWGAEAMLLTLSLYTERGWRYYGGGASLEEGRQALIWEHNGNRLAFLGCNSKGGSFAQAGPNQPGAVSCDLDWMAGEVVRLRQAGCLPIATFQHFEYYTYQAQPDQKRDFRRLAEAGAVIVSGSQAHQPQGFEFIDDALIHYGLGNLFFDQYDVSLATRQAFIDRHVFYAGRHISTELLAIMFLDYARPRPMTPEERDQLLEAVFSASGW